MEKPKFISEIDFELLRDQKEELIELTFELYANIKKAEQAKNKTLVEQYQKRLDLTEGVISFIDATQDYVSSNGGVLYPNEWVIVDSKNNTGNIFLAESDTLTELLEDAIVFTEEEAKTFIKAHSLENWAIAKLKEEC